MADGKVRFVRINGRVVPVGAKRGQKKAEKGNGYKESRRYDAGNLPAVRNTSKGTSAVVGAAAGIAMKKFGWSTAGAALGGVLAYAATRSVKSTKKAKGESDEQAARRVALGNREYNAIRKGKTEI